MEQQTAAELGEETREIAENIEREVAGVKVDNIARNTFKLTYETHLPPVVADMARDNGFHFHANYGAKAVFQRDH